MLLSHVSEKMGLLFPEGDVACFSEYMEMWIHGARIEGLAVWLSGALRIQGKFFLMQHVEEYW